MNYKTCDRCKVDTEQFLLWPVHSEEDIILCPECCMNYMGKLLMDADISIINLEDWAHESSQK